MAKKKKNSDGYDDGGQLNLDDMLFSADQRHYRDTEQYVARADRLYGQAIKRLSELATQVGNIPQSQSFSFQHNKAVAQKVQQTILDLASSIEAVVDAGCRHEWDAACIKGDKYIEQIRKTADLAEEKIKTYQDRNLEALAAFQERKVEGLNLSERVWKMVSPLKEEVELVVDTTAKYYDHGTGINTKQAITKIQEAIGSGTSAAELSRQVRECLREPNKLFRRVKDKYGNLTLSKAAQLYHPGQGVYRSSYKNAMRMCRTEINMAYRQSDTMRWQQLDFVVGMEVNLSNNHTTKDPKSKGVIKLIDICDELKGKYPKDFKFVGWHPQCRCFVTPILKTLDEIDAERLSTDEEGNIVRAESVNEVAELPENFKKYVSDNRERIKGWSSTPYYLKDNFVGGDPDGISLVERREIKRKFEESGLYREVKIDEKSGGVLAIHKDHNQHKNDKKTYFPEQLTGDDLERECYESLYKSGHVVQLCNESKTYVENGETKTFSALDMILDGKRMDIKSVTSTGYYGNQLYDKHRQIKRYIARPDTDDIPDSVMLYFHDPEYFDESKLTGNSINFYLKKVQNVRIRNIYVKIKGREEIVVYHINENGEITKTSPGTRQSKDHTVPVDGAKLRNNTETSKNSANNSALNQRNRRILIHKRTKSAKEQRHKFDSRIEAIKSKAQKYHIDTDAIDRAYTEMDLQKLEQEISAQEQLLSRRINTYAATERKHQQRTQADIDSMQASWNMRRAKLYGVDETLTQAHELVKTHGIDRKAIDRFMKSRQPKTRAEFEAEVLELGQMVEELKDEAESWALERMTWFWEAQGEALKEGGSKANILARQIKEYIRKSSKRKDWVAFTNSDEYYRELKNAQFKVTDIKEHRKQVLQDWEEAKKKRGPSYSANMPKELQAKSVFLEGENYVYSKEFFDLLKQQPVLELKLSGKGGSWESGGVLVHIEGKERLHASRWFRHKIVYHEFGHAIVDQRGLLLDNELVEMIQKRGKSLTRKFKKEEKKPKITRKVYDTKEKKFVNKEFECSNMAEYIEMQMTRVMQRLTKVSPEVLARRGITKDDIEELFCSTADTLKALTRKYGYGHDNKYFSSQDNRTHEYMAHAFECVFEGNPVLKHFLPDVYREMLEYVKKIKNKDLYTSFRMR